MWNDPGTMRWCFWISIFTYLKVTIWWIYLHILLLNLWHTQKSNILNTVSSCSCFPPFYSGVLSGSYLRQSKSYLTFALIILIWWWNIYQNIKLCLSTYLRYKSLHLLGKRWEFSSKLRTFSPVGKWALREKI
jgi:hypothetical protein